MAEREGLVAAPSLRDHTLCAPSPVALAPYVKPAYVCAFTSLEYYNISSYGLQKLIELESI